MAEEKITEIISQEAFDQVKQLGEELDVLNSKMAESIKTSVELRKTVSSATTYKEMASAMSQVNDAATQFVKTSSDRLNVERQIKAEGEKMVKVLEGEELGMKRALDAMNTMRKGSDDLAASIVRTDLELEKQKADLKKLKEFVTDFDKAPADLKKNIEDLTMSIAKLTAERSEMTRQLKESVNIMDNTEDTYRGMNARLVALRNAYKSLTEEQRDNADIGGAMREAINNLDERLKAIDKSIGSNQRNVGNYEVILEKALNGEMNMRSVLKELQQELTNQEVKRRLLGQTIAEQEKKVQQLLDTEGKESASYKAEAQTLDGMKQKYTDMGAAISDLTQKTGALKDAQSDAQTAVKNAAQDAGGVKAAVEGVSLLTQSYNALNAMMAVSGADSQKLADIFNKMMIIQNGLNSINKIAITLQKESLLRLKIREAVDKVRLVYIKAQTSDTVKQTAAEVAETAATAANTKAEQVNTSAKSGNTAATVAATAATGGLAAGEGVATATSFTLAGALKAVGVAIKSIPGVGWILAIASALAAVIPVLVSVRKKHDDLNVSVNEGRRFAQVYNEAANSIEKEVMQMDRLVSKINNSERGSREWEKAVKAVADNLGVSSKWLKENIDKTNELAEAWKNVRLAQAIDEKSVEKAAKMMTDTVDGMEKLREEVEKSGDIYASDKQLKKYGEDLRNALNLTNDEVKKMYQESAAELVEARKTMTAAEGAQLSIWDFFLKKATNLAKEKGLEIIKKSDEVTKSVKDNMDSLADAARDSASQIVQNEIDGFDNYADFIADTAKKNAETAKKLQLKTIAGAKEYYAKQKKAALDAAWENHKANKTSQEQYEKEVLAIKTRYANEERLATDSLRKQSLKSTDSAAEYYKGILRELESYEDKSLTKTYRGRLNKLEKMKAAELAKYKLTEEQKANVEKLYAIKRAEIEEDEQKRVQQSIAAAYAVQVEQRLKLLETNAKEAGKKGYELSALLLDIEEQRYQQEAVNREEAFKKETNDVEEGSEEWVAIRNKYNSMEELAEAEHQSKMREIRKSGIDQQLDEVMKQYADLRNILITEGGGNLSQSDELQTNYDESKAALQLFIDDKARILEEGLMTEEAYYRRLHEMQAKAAQDEKALNDMRKENVWSMANATVDAFNSIAGSIKGMLGDSVNAVIAQQALSLAQVYMEQGVAIASAIRLAFEDKSNVTWYEAAAKAVASVALVIGETVAAFKAVKQAKIASAQAQVSAYAEGTSHHPGGDAVVGEGGKPELVSTGNKSFVVAKPTLIKDLPVGAKVTPLEVQSLREMPQQVDFDLSEVVEHMTKIEKRDRVHIDVGENVYSYIVKGANRTRLLNKQFSH